MKLDPTVTVITVGENHDNCENHLSGMRKQQMQEQPLPIPFELPTNFQQKIMIALEEQRLVGRARAKFITKIAEAMFRFKSYPTREEYQHVAMQIIKKFSETTSCLVGLLCGSFDGPNGIPSQTRWSETWKTNNAKDHETKISDANLPYLYPITRRG